MEVREVVYGKRGGAGTGASGLHRETADLSHRVAGSVAGERAEGVQRRLGVEASLPQRLEKLLDQPDAVHGGRRTYHEQGKDVGVLVRQPAESPVRLPDSPLPTFIRRRYLQLTKEDLDHPIQQSA